MKKGDAIYLGYTNAVDEQDLVGVVAVAGHELPDEDLVGRPLAVGPDLVRDLEAEGQRVAHLRARDVGAASENESE